MNVDEVEGLGALDEILETEDRAIVLDFWGTWCQPCRALRPHLEQLAADHAKKWRFVAVHVENNVDAVERYNVTSTPTLIYLRDGDELHRTSGAVTPSTVDDALLTHS